MLILALLISGLPLNAGIEIVGGAHERALTMNICHPLESATAVAPLLLARPATLAMRPVFVAIDEAPQNAAAQISEPAIEPDSPPPETSL
jgi:hypothetical protein